LFRLRKKFKDKFIIIESDDWGLERALTFESISWMKKRFGEMHFSRWALDSLETSEDLNLLFDLLESYKSKFEFPPVITANFITHNINYTESDNLNLIPISKGFNRESEDVRNLYKKGIENKYIFPQLHGYCHYNLVELKKYFFTDEGREAFEKKFLLARSTMRGSLSFLHGELSKNNLSDFTIKESVAEFRNLFGFSSQSIIPPTFILDLELLGILKQNNIKLIQSANRLTSSDKKKYYLPLFKKKNGIYWSARNGRLDPHADYNFNYEQCLNSIIQGFENKSPAIIDFHRANFAGKFAPEYRDRTLTELKKLFDSIYNKWPDAKFIHTQQLIDMLWQPEIK
jgi:hypothetical protein